MAGPTTTEELPPRNFDPIWGWIALIGLLMAFSILRLTAWPESPSSPLGRNRFRVDINRASLPELMALPNLGPATAGKIVEYRQKHGPFVEVDDLQRVPGIGPATLRGLRPLLMVSNGEDTDGSLAKN